MATFTHRGTAETSLRTTRVIGRTTQRRLCGRRRGRAPAWLVPWSYPLHRPATPRASRVAGRLRRRLLIHGIHFDAQAMHHD